MVEILQGDCVAVLKGLDDGSVLIELNPDYVKLAKKRTAQMGLF